MNLAFITYFDRAMNNSRSRWYGVLLITFLSAGCTNNPHPGLSGRILPNIIIILADDAGYVDFGFMGSRELQTPQLDTLAADGVIFTDAHVSASVCAPSRAGLISGRYQQRFGSECNAIPMGRGLDLGQRTLADVMKERGYNTIAIGKWHLGMTPAYHPNQRGFDDFVGFLAGGRSYFPDEEVDQPGNQRALQHNGQEYDFTGYLTDVFGDSAVSYVERHHADPFFMYLAFNAVHTPMEAKAEDLARFEPGPRQTLAAMTWSMDENIGKLIRILKAKGVYDNTLVFFLSDNGGAINNQSHMGPLKGWKGNKFEGGHRVPFVLSWPRQIAGGQTFGGLTSSLDIFTTAVMAAGGQRSVTAGLDGVDLIPYLTHQKQGDPHESLFWRKDQMAAARVREHKVIRLDNYGFRMYDLEHDPGETTDLTKKLPQLFDHINAELTHWEKGLEIPRWLEESDWNQATYEIHRALMNNRQPNYRTPKEMMECREASVGINPQDL